VIRSDSGAVVEIVEEADCTPEQSQIREINAGVYAFRAADLAQALAEVSAQNAQDEFYLTDVIGILVGRGARVEPVEASPEEVVGINSQDQLAEATRLLQRRTVQRLLDSGVWILDPDRTYIDDTVQIGLDTVIYPGVILEGATTIGEGCVIYSNCRIQNSQLGEQVTVLDGSVIVGSEIAEGCVIGPFAHLRPQTRLKRKAKVGNFCEVKKAVIGEGSKVPHLAYIGDTQMGEKVNIGAGTITCNYDGFAKHETVIEDDVFVGSNTNLVAPVTVGKGAIIAAGSTINEAVPPDAVAFGRAPQVNKEGRAAATRKKREAMAPPKDDDD
jgi:bifunctional UDP-N-acetylglucosamine pyrophosphorylase/glucosamine-1-phosphate N-acetyltransferase